VVLLLVHPSWDVRRSITATISRSHASSAGVADPLLGAFVAWLPVFEHRQGALRLGAIPWFVRSLWSPEL
jgi:hypothetical protein